MKKLILTLFLCSVLAIAANSNDKACVVTITSIDKATVECTGQGTVCSNVLDCVKLPG